MTTHLECALQAWNCFMLPLTYLRTYHPTPVHRRLRDARGGDIIVRPGAISEAPAIRAHPTDVRVQEGMVAELKVTAVVSKEE
jgi:hypothetical protein